MNCRPRSCTILTRLLVILVLATARVAHTQDCPWSFFAFDNGVGRGTGITPDEQAELLAELGYQGIGYTGVKDIPAMLQALQKHQLKMVSTYVQINLDGGQPPYDPQLPLAIEQLKGQGTALWIHVHGRRSADHPLDAEAVRVIRAVADLAGRSQLPVVLYPHTGFYVADDRDALRIVKLVDRPNVGTSFNLCHFLKQHDPAELEQVLADSLPFLRLVSINGADAGDTRTMGWDRLIQTLDRGSYDLLPLLRQLKAAGYSGPIGLQCYAIPGDFRANLRRSIEAWKRLCPRVTP